MAVDKVRLYVAPITLMKDIIIKQSVETSTIFVYSLFLYLTWLQAAIYTFATPLNVKAFFKYPIEIPEGLDR